MTDATREFVRLEVADGVATMRLDRPKMNAIDVQVQEGARMHFGGQRYAQCVIEAGKDHCLQSWKRPTRILADDCGDA